MNSEPQQTGDSATATAQGGTAAGADFLVVGIGASAGGLRALESFFANMPDGEPGMAFVVVVHLSPEHQSNLAELLGRYTNIPVMQVTGPVRVEPNHVYVIPPAKQLGMSDGMIYLSDPDLPRGQRVPIDHFFRTLAETHGELAAAVVLSGSGSDGAIGLPRIKEMGGITMVQDPAEAEHDQMPKNAIATGFVDYVLPVSRMGERLLKYRTNLKTIDLPTAPAIAEQEEPSADAAVPSLTDILYEILAILRTRTGHNFASYKRSTLTRRVERRMQVNDLPDSASYLHYLRRHPEELQFLLRDLLISVTNFFRDSEVWEALQLHVIPLLFKDKERAEDVVRVWVPGCATGEEAYTIAVLLHEYAAKMSVAPRLQVFATDLDERAITFAREATYPDTIAGDVSQERLRRYFNLVGHNYRVAKEVRETVLFAVHDVLKDPPFSRLDLISCRNLLIYLNRDAQEQVLNLFHFALNTDGHLLLGMSESADGLPQLYTTSDKKNHIYSRRTLPRYAQPIPSLPSFQIERSTTNLPSIPPTRPRIVSTAELHQNLLDVYAPPSVVIDQNYDVVHLSQQAGRYLQVGGGEISHNILRLVHPDLRLDLRSALFAATQRELANESRRIKLRLDGAERWVRMIVRPVLEPQQLRGYILIMFDDVAPELPAPEGEPATGDVARIGDSLARQLEEEVLSLRSQLRSTVEQYETSVEELKASNEELQAINEELRSATEELETSKEEMQAVNEELLTVNQELKLKIDELGRVNSDLQNLIHSTDIATIFLNRQLQVKRFTPQVERLFNMIASDIDRPIAHLTHRLRYNGLLADAEAVLRDLRASVREVQTTDDDWYLMRLLPYRTMEDRIDGVVITFVDITARKRMEQQLLESRDELDLRVEARTSEVTEANNRLQVEEQLLRERNLTLRSLSGRLLEVQEDERRKVALELHDQIGQYLTGLRMVLETVTGIDSDKPQIDEALELLADLTQ